MVNFFHHYYYSFRFVLEPTPSQFHARGKNFPPAYSFSSIQFSQQLLPRPWSEKSTNTQHTSSFQQPVSSQSILRSKFITDLLWRHIFHKNRAGSHLLSFCPLRASTPSSHPLNPTLLGLNDLHSSLSHMKTAVGGSYTFTPIIQMLSGVKWWFNSVMYVPILLLWVTYISLDHGMTQPLSVTSERHRF